MRKTYVTKNSEETIGLAQKLGQQFKGGETVFLEGDLGGGKTTFSKGLGKGLGISGAVTSPTFTIEQVYEGRDNIKMFHYDFYRLGAGDITEVAFLESLETEGAVVVIEWGTNLKELLPENRLEVYFSYIDENERRIEIRPFGVKFEKMVAAL